MAIAHVIKRGFGNVHALVTRGFGSFGESAPDTPSHHVRGSRESLTARGSRTTYTVRGSR